METIKLPLPPGKVLVFDHVRGVAYVGTVTVTVTPSG